MGLYVIQDHLTIVAVQAPGSPILSWGSPLRSTSIAPCTIMTDTPKSSDYPIEPVLTASEEGLHPYTFFRVPNLWSGEASELTP